MSHEIHPPSDKHPAIVVHICEDPPFPPINLAGQRPKIIQTRRPDVSERGTWWLRNITADCFHAFIIALSSPLFLNYWHFYILYIYIQCMVECGWCLFYIMFIFSPFLFSLKQIFKRRNLFIVNRILDLVMLWCLDCINYLVYNF